MALAHDKNNLKTFLPLISILLLIVLLTFLSQFFRGFSIVGILHDFMGFFVLVFGIFKAINLNTFAVAYSKYDLIAKQSKIYAYAYPFIEIFLGIAYLVRWQLLWINIVTFVVMSIGSIGVAKELLEGKKINCACLGVLFKIPMTWVTFFEDFLMASMALFMLVF